MRFNTTVCFLVLCFSAIGQVGYYNKKNYLKIEGLGTFPNVIYNYYSYDGTRNAYNKKLEEKKDRFNYGFRCSYYRLLKKNVALGVEAGIDFADIYLQNRSEFLIPPYYNSVIEVKNIQVSKIAVRNYSVMPKIEFSTRNAILPMGFTHEIGVGITYSHVVQNDYAFNYGAITTNDTSGIVTEKYLREHFINYNTFSVQQYTFLYGLGLKIPISKYLFINYGFRYNLNLKPFFSKRQTQRYISDFLYSSGKIDDEIRAQRFRNLINFSVGLTCVF